MTTLRSGARDVSPVDGAPAAWVGAGGWAAVKAAGIELWSASEVPVRHLGTLLERTLADDELLPT